MFLTSTIMLAALLGVTEHAHRTIAEKAKPSFNGATRWFNSTPLTLEGLRGKVVLIDFWTYSCINWRRALPWTREWAAKYKDQGLVVVGVHTPEFSFEKKEENVSKAVKEMDIDYPVAMDNNYNIWNSFQNQFWPALYLVDAKGKLRYQKFGEGDYTEAELQIQKLLKEATGKNITAAPAMLQPGGYEAQPDWKSLASPETYVSYYRARGFSSPGGIVRDAETLYSLPRKLQLNQWALSGKWDVGEERLFLGKGTGKIVYRFHARDLHLVMGPPAAGTSVKFRVLIDGRPPGISHGLDTDDNGNGTVTDQSMYHLIRQQGPIVDHEFQIEFLSPGVEVYVFTFG